MKKWGRKSKYIIIGMMIIFLFVVLAFKIKAYLNEKEQEQAIRQTQHYLAENYQNMKYEIQQISSSNDFKHYGYYEHAVTVQNTDTKETFEVFYDKNMMRMEDVDYWERELSFIKKY